MKPRSIRLGKTGWYVGALGLGTSRWSEGIDCRDVFHRALELGTNLIDTAPNYRRGGSERELGRRLRESSGRELFVISKTGYWREERPFEGDSEFCFQTAGGGWYSLHPEAIERQVEGSRIRLGQKCLSAVLLHNPEELWRYLGTRFPETERRAEFERAMVTAFGALERLVERGAIEWYGVSSGVLPRSWDLSSKLFSPRSWRALAEAAAPRESRFALLAFPFNLVERQPLSAAWEGRNLFEEAAALDLGVLFYRTLRSFSDGVELRWRAADEGEEITRAVLLERVRRFEKSGADFSWSRVLGDPRLSLISGESWRRLYDVSLRAPREQLDADGSDASRCCAEAVDALCAEIEARAILPCRDVPISVADFLCGNVLGANRGAVAERALAELFRLASSAAGVVGMTRPDHCLRNWRALSGGEESDVKVFFPPKLSPQDSPANGPLPAQFT